MRARISDMPRFPICSHCAWVLGLCGRMPSNPRRLGQRLVRGSRRAIASEIDRGVIDELRAGVRYSTSNTRRSAGGPTSRSASMDHRKEAGAFR